MVDILVHFYISNIKSIESVTSYILYGSLKNIHERLFVFNRLKLVIQKDMYDKLSHSNQNNVFLDNLSDHIKVLDNKISDLDNIYKISKFVLSLLNIFQLYNLSDSILDLGKDIASSTNIPLDKTLLLILNGACAYEAASKLQGFVIKDIGNTELFSDLLEILHGLDTMGNESDV